MIIRLIQVIFGALILTACAPEEAPDKTPAPTIRLAGPGVFDFATADPLDASVCIVQTGECTTASATGYELRAPADRGFEIELELPGYASTLIPVPAMADDTEMPGLILLSDEVLDAFAGMADVTLSPDAGHVAFFAGAEGVHANLEPAAGDGPYYQNDFGFLDRDATATGKASGVAWFNVPPGAYWIEASYKTLECAFPMPNGDEPDAQRVGVRAGWLTGGLSAACADLLDIAPDHGVQGPRI